MGELEEYYYNRAESEDGGLKRKLATKFVNDLCIGKCSVLEVGCGTAHIVKYLSPEIDYHGVDVSEYAINNARKYQKSDRAVNLKVSSSSHLPYNRESFDIIISLFSLEHFEKPRKSLDEMIRTLKSGGHLIILAPNLELPISKPNAIRHKSVFYKIWFMILRFWDWILRIFGIFKFRTIKNNYTEVTGKYERPDDDLRYIVSSFEVVGYLKRAGFSFIKTPKFQSTSGAKNTVKSLISRLPAMNYYGETLFVIAKKINEEGLCS